MGLKNAVLKAGATISVSGGTDLSFVDNGVTIPNGVQVVATSDTDYQTRRVATVKYRPATLDPKTAIYTKDKKSISFVKPIVLASGQVVFNTIRVEREVHPSLSAADASELNKLASQLLTDADLDGFWSNGSLS